MMDGITLRVGADLPADQLYALYDSLGWYAYSRGERADELPDAIARSTYVVTAWRTERLVGLARALSDDSAVMLLQDVLVLKKEQGRGIGTALVRNCLERFGHVRSKLVLTDDRPEQLAFYRSLGLTSIADLRRARLNLFVDIEGIE